MKAEITDFKEGFTTDGSTPYRLQLIPENEEEKILTKELNRKYVVRVSPCFRTRDGAISWWGKT